MSNSASNYTSLPLKTPTADAWGYLSTPSTVVDHSGVSQFGRISNGFYGVTFTSARRNRFLSGAYVVIATPEYAHDTNYGPVMCRIANTAGSTALGRSAGFQLNTFENSSASTPNSLVLTDRGVTIGFAAFSFSDGRTAHISNNNKFPNPNDIFAWYSGGFSSSSTISRGDIQSPVGNTPLQMDITGIDPHLGTYSGSSSITRWNISPASRGQRWRVKVFVRASTPVSNGQIIIFGADNQGRTFVNGNWVDIKGENIPITTEWQEVTFAYTFTSPDVAFIQVRLDGPQTGGEGTTVWWDGLRVYEESSVDYRIVPGASAFGVTPGATYNSQLTSLNSRRAATAYGTVVIPNRRALGISAGAYLENTFNVRGVSTGNSSSVFDITFEKPLNNTNYCAVLAGEYESDQDNVVVSSITSTNEFSDLLVRAGDNNRFKTVNGFRIESRKQQASNNSWSLNYASLTDPNGRTERIHFMVFGGGTYGQP